MSARSPYPSCPVRRRPPASLLLSLCLCLWPWPALLWPLAAQAGGSRVPVSSPGLLAVLAVLVLACAGLLILWRRAQRRLQQALDSGRVAEQSLRQLLDNAPAAIWRTDAHGRLVFANRRLCEALGRSQAELQALARFFDAFDPVTAARMAGRDAQALARAEPVLGQESRTDAGGRRHYDLIKVRVLDASGRPEGVISMATEVTAQREAESQLQQRYALERELLLISRQLVSGGRVEAEAAISRALALVGGITRADRAYLFLLHPGGQRADNTHEWCAEGVSPQIGRLQDCDLDGRWPWASAQLREGRRVEVLDSTLLPAEAALDLQEMREQGIGALLLLPLHAGGELAAIVGLDVLRPRERWGEADIGLLQAVGELLSLALLRSRAEREREQALAELDGLLAAIPDLIFVLDAEGRFLDFRGGDSAPLLLPPPQFLGQSMEAVLPGALAAQTRAALADVLHGGAPARFDYRIEVSGRPLDFELRLVRLDGGRALAISRDISARKGFERALAQSEERFRELLEALPEIAVQGYDSALRVTFWNTGSERLYGYSRRQALGRSLTELIIPEPAREQVRQRAMAWFAGAALSPPEELRLLRADGSAVQVLSSHVMQRTSDGRQELFCVDIDLGPLRRAEEQLRLAASVFTHTQEGVLITDPQARIIEVNRAFCEITGYAREDVIGRTPAVLSSDRHGPELYEAMWTSLRENGHWAGEIWNRRRDGELFAEFLKINAVRNEAGKVVNFVGLFADITAQKSYQQHLERIAHYDALTGLPNRVLLADRLNQAMARARRQQQWVAVAYIDLDGFKAINDQHGHDIGDRFLRAVGERMRSQLREWDTVARIGGDEFVVLLVDLPEGEVLQELLKRLSQALSAPLQLDSLKLPVAASIGVSRYPQEAELEAEQLLRQADQAMYEAKHGGKGHIRYFDAALDASNRSRQKLLVRLREGLDAGELVLYYQPRVDVRTGRVLGLEALMRWNHPERGLLAPDAFLAATEGEALGVDLGEWALQRALADLASWSSAGGELGVSVNIAPRHLLSPGFVEQLQALLQRHPLLPYGSLMLEVLESSVLDDLERATAVIARCRDLGVGFALDDFGTGYSSLAYLKHLPFSELKIDRSFVRDMLVDPEDLAIIQGVVGLARAFHLRLVAEGVESAEHARALLRIGCHHAQGYGIARPMPPEAVADWLRAWRPDPAWAGVRELPLEGHPAMFVLVAHRGWLQQIRAWLDADRADAAPPTRPVRGLGRWLSSLPSNVRESEAGRAVWRLHQQLHEQFDAMLVAHAAGGSAAAGAQRAGLIDIGERFVRDLDALLAAMAKRAHEA